MAGLANFAVRKMSFLQQARQLVHLQEIASALLLAM